MTEFQAGRSMFAPGFLIKRVQLGAGTAIHENELRNSSKDVAKLGGITLRYAQINSAST